MKNAVFAAVAALSLAGCMTEREYMLRKQNAANQAAHPETFEAFRLKGPVTLEPGSEIVVASPTQPFVPLSVPDTAASQREVARDVVTGAVIGYGLNRAGGAKSTRNTTITEGGAP